MVVRASLSCGNDSYTMLNARGLRIHEKMRCRNFPSSSPKTRMSPLYIGVNTFAAGGKTDLLHPRAPALGQTRRGFNEVREPKGRRLCASSRGCDKRTCAP